MTDIVTDNQTQLKESIMNFNKTIFSSVKFGLHCRKNTEGYILLRSSDKNSEKSKVCLNFDILDTSMINVLIRDKDLEELFVANGFLKERPNTHRDYRKFKMSNYYGDILINNLEDLEKLLKISFIHLCKINKKKKFKQ